MISTLAKRQAAANAKFGTRLVSQHPSQAPSGFASRRTPYAREASPDAKFGARLVHGPSAGPSARSPAGRRMANTARQSSANAKFGTRLISESRSALHQASRRTAATPHPNESRSGGVTSSRELPPRWPRMTANPLTHMELDQISDAESDESGVGLYREICNWDR